MTAERKTARLPVRLEIGFAYIMSMVIFLLMGAVSVISLVSSTTIYPDSELTEAFLPNDVVNLVIGLPILLVAMWLTRRGRLTGLLLWPGALFYVLYTYIVYLIGMPFNALFVAYLALVTLSLYGLAALVASIDAHTVRETLTGAVRERLSGGIIVVLGSIFLLRVVVEAVGAATGDETVSRVAMALYTTDFLTAPASIIGGILLWRKHALGYVAGLGLLFQLSMLFIGLIAIFILQPFMTDAAFPLVDTLVVAAMGLVCFVPFGLFLRGAASKQ